MKLPAKLTAMTAKQVRDATTYLIGAGGLIYETVVGGAEKPTLIIAFVGMLGLPLFLKKDEADAKAEIPPIPAPPARSVLIPTPDVPEPVPAGPTPAAPPEVAA